HALEGPDGASLNVVHRDVSLANVLVGVDGEVKLADFGIAKARFASAHTESGVLKGKIHYISPEYAAGESLDSRSDLFSLGIVLYQLASGVRPFDGEHEGQVMHKILSASPAPLALCAPHVDPGLAAIVERLLSRDRALRAPEGTAGLARELDEWLRANGHHE